MMEMLFPLKTETAILILIHMIIQMKISINILINYNFISPFTTFVASHCGRRPTCWSNWMQTVFVLYLYVFHLYLICVSFVSYLYRIWRQPTCWSNWMQTVSSSSSWSDDGVEFDYDHDHHDNIMIFLMVHHNSSCCQKCQSLLFKILDYKGRGPKKKTFLVVFYY